MADYLPSPPPLFHADHTADDSSFFDDWIGVFGGCGCGDVEDTFTDKGRIEVSLSVLQSLRFRVILAYSCGVGT